MDDSGAAKKPVRKRAATPKARAPSKRPAAVVEAPVVVEPAPKRRSRRLLVASATLVVLAAGAAAGAFLVLRGEDVSSPEVRAGVPILVSADELAAYADATGAGVYWAGAIEDRRLELTTTSTGTFVRYLPPGIAAGDDDRTLTIATYPLANAFATATARARSAEAVSEKTGRGGLVVWNRGRPTSIYLAFPGVRQLIEIYSPDVDEARRLARSGQVVAAG